MRQPDQIVRLSETWNSLWAILAAAGGALGAHLWQRYLGRMASVRWSALHYPLATGGESPQHGRVEVLWNGTPVTNLQWTVVEIENESSKDLENVEVKMGYRDGTTFLGRGSLAGTSQFLPWTTGYTAAYNRVFAAAQLANPPTDGDPPPNQTLVPQEQLEQDQRYLFSNREVVVPVFNRGTKLTLTMLVTHPSGGVPYVEVVVEHLGVRLRQHTQRPQVLGVVQNHAVLLGLLAGTGITIAIAWRLNRAGVAAPLAFLTGVMGPFIGAGLIHLKRLLARAIG